jgi:cytochrome c-type biogenesis protein CcmH
MAATMQYRWVRSGFLAALALLALLTAGPARAVQPDEVLNDPALEQRARVISRELRCMVCQNQSIDDSDAPLARDLRILVRERLTAGDSNRQVFDFLVARYGDFVLLKPRFTTYTLLLWLLPPALLLGGASFLLAIVRRRRRAVSVPVNPERPLTSAEQLKLQQLLDK